MNNQIQSYSLDDKSFYTMDEFDLNNIAIYLKTEKKLIEEFNLFATTEEKDSKFCFEDLEDYRNEKYNSNKSKWFKREINKFMKDHNYGKDNIKYKKSLRTSKIYSEIRTYIKRINMELNQMIDNNKDPRRLNAKMLKPWTKISLFESDLSRTLDLEIDELTKDLFIIKLYRYKIMNQLINNGFDLYVTKQRKNKKITLARTKALDNSFGIKLSKEIKFRFVKERYVILTSSAGQIRTKKAVFIKKSTLDEFTNTLMCGLTIDDINKSEERGMNIVKFLSYLALVNSATDVIEGFDINKAIVIDDFETMVNGEVDFIDKTLKKETRKINKKIENENGEIEKIVDHVVEEYWELADKPIRKPMDIKITHSDGCGWVLPSVSKKNKMLRLPWIKGLVTPCNFLAYCEKFNNGNYEVLDIYGKTWDLKKDNIKYVFSRSQFKMHKYYPNKYNEDGTIKEYGWETYQKNFIANNCHANYCNEESDTFEKKRYNYQMLQTLTDIEPEEIDEIIEPTVELLKNAYTDRNIMLKLLGATKLNKKKTYLQEAIRIYPELINDKHVKEDLSDIINSKRKEAKCGKIQLDCTYTYLIPDVFAWMKYSIGGIKDPEGLLENNQVFCKLYKNKKELLVERSPHLAKEHGVRDHAYSKDKETWFCTDGIYTSCHDLISKLLQFDNDGDRALVVASDKLIEVAKRNMVGVVPLFYEMGKAAPQEINNKNIYEALKLAFRYGNIGMYSNKLTKLWNQEGEKDLDLIKILCALNNFSIDAAKTLEMPRATKEMKEKINAIDQLPLPYFFQFAKKKENKKVAPRNNSTVNQVCKKIEDIQIPVKKGTKNQKYDFSGLGNFRSSTLMHNPKIEINEKIIAKYKELNKSKNKFFMWSQSWGLKKEEVSGAVYQTIEYEFKNYCKELNVDIVDAVDMVIRYIYKHNRDCKKSFVFNCFGLMIINNLKTNIKKSLEDGYIQCSTPGCGKRVKKQSNSQTMCKVCSENKIQERDRKRKKKKKKTSNAAK